MRRIALAIVAALLLAGCGGSSSLSPDKQFVARANAICARAQKKARPLISAENKLKPRNLDQAVVLLTKTGEELQSVTPPVPLRAGYRRYLRRVKHEIALTAQLAHYVHNRNLAGVRSLEGQLDSKATNGYAAVLGLKVCAEETG